MNPVRALLSEPSPSALHEEGDERRTSFDGYSFNIHQEKWVLSRHVVVDLDWVRNRLSPEVADSAIRTLAYYGVRKSAETTKNYAYQLEKFTKYAMRGTQVLDGILSTDLISYRSTFTKNSEWNLGTLRSFLNKWSSLKLPGIEDDAIKRINEFTLSSNLKGEAVRTRDPERGAFSDIEFAALDSRLMLALEEKTLSLSEVTLIDLLMAIGQRAKQISDLKVRDRKTKTDPSGFSRHWLAVPFAKQRDMPWRSAFKDVALNPDRAKILNVMVQEHAERFCDLVKGADKEMLDEMPMFPDWEVVKQHRREPGRLRALLMRTDVIHRSSGSLRLEVQAAVRKLKVPSERVGILKVSSKRFRITFATNLAREGCGPLVISDALMHSTTSMARVYTENTAENLNNINAAVAKQLAPTANAFMGIVIRNESEATRCSDPSSRIRARDGSKVGNCGTCASCTRSVPVACYTCPSFQPWLDAPHEVVLQDLLNERDYFEKECGDPRMAGINDLTILAVELVIQTCKRLKAQAGRALSNE